MAQKSINSEISKVISEIHRNYKPQKIILYGSFATGGATSHSDIDLLIIKRTKKRFIERISDVLLSCHYAIPVEPLVYTPEEIDKRLKMGDFFIKDILQNGKVLYG